jgi:hypothetical protein
MDILLGLSYGIGLLLIGTAATVYWSNGSSIVALWLFVVGIVWLVFTGGCQAQRAILSAETEETDDPNRPHVSVTDAGIITKPGDNAPTVFVTIRNSGKRPAYGLIWRAAFAMRNFPDIGVLDLDRKSIAARFDLAPDAPLFYEWKFSEWGDGNWPLIKSGKAAILAFGEISYRDGPKTGICIVRYRLIHGGDSFVPEGKFGIAKEGNSTGPECKKDSPN